MTDLPSPYPYFGGKAKVAGEIWKRLGDPPVYVEPFFGSGAVWLARPNVNPDRHLERLNDLSAYIPNFWRAMQHDPAAVAHHANNPAFECDLHARHLWLVNQKGDLGERLMASPDYYDAKIAGYWVWGAALWIGSGWCSGKGGWIAHEGRLVRAESVGIDADGVKRQTLHQGDAGRGIARQTLHQRNAGQGIARKTNEGGVQDYFEALQARLHRGVSVHCGDWSRLLKPAIAWGLNGNNPTLTGIVLDPPYTFDNRDDVYEHDQDISAEVAQWALENGDNKNLRIAYCAYSTPDEVARFAAAEWEVVNWKANGGYANNGAVRNGNKYREVVYFSPHCLKPGGQMSLFDVRIER